MKLFGRDKIEKPKITQIDREWVEGNFQWLMKVYGHPRINQFIFTKTDFPETFRDKEIKIDNLILDCCNHLDLDKNLFSYTTYEDIRDSMSLPYGFEDRPRDCHLEYDFKTGKFTFHLAKNIFKHPKWLISSICYEFTKARLIQSNLEYDTGTDTNVFIYLASVFVGYGVIIGQNLTDFGVHLDSMWETKWSYIADIPYPIMAYALAVFARLRNEANPSWKELLPSEIQTEFELSYEYIGKSTDNIFDPRRIDNALNAEKLFVLADQQYQTGEISKAISTLQKIIFITEDFNLKSDVFNNIGYYKLRLGKFGSSISDFKNAIKLDPNYGYANDNLGFALIMTGNLEEGKKYLDKALETENNDDAYSYRNLALYYQKKGDNESAKENFLKAFDMNTPVDLLDYYFGLFLIETGEKDKGLEHIKISADIGEYEGEKYLEEMNNN